MASLVSTSPIWAVSAAKKHKKSWNDIYIYTHTQYFCEGRQGETTKEDLSPPSVQHTCDTIWSFRFIDSSTLQCSLFFTCHPDVCCQCNFQPATKSQAVQCRDDRLWKVTEILNSLTCPRREFWNLVCAHTHTHTEYSIIVFDLEETETILRGVVVKLMIGQNRPNNVHFFKMSENHLIIGKVFFPQRNISPTPLH